MGLDEVAFVAVGAIAWFALLRIWRMAIVEERK
jgi:hypothetical protein